MIVTDLRKQQAVDADPRAIQQINFTANLDRDDGATIFFIIEQAKRNCFWIFTGICKSFANAISSNAISFNAIPSNARYSLIFISIKWHNTIV